MTPPQDPKSRFSDRVADYISARPTYPPEALTLLLSHTRLAPNAKVADIGAGTGISSAWLLSANLEVFAVEPNPEMRAAADAALAANPRYHSIPASAEATTLPDSSIDLILAAQAFHWFDPIPTRREFQRILKPAGYVALLWNDRLTSGSPFLNAYEALLQSLGPAYTHTNHRNITSQKQAIKDFFPAGYQLLETPNHQDLTEQSLLRRAFSSSYTPKPSDPLRPKLEADLKSLFHQTQQSGTVRMQYNTQLFLGRLT